MHSRLTAEQVQDFMRFLYFGNYSDAVSVSIDKAYLDFNRTLQGLEDYRNKHNKKNYVSGAKKELYKSIHELLKSSFSTQRCFDEWHKRTCEQLRQEFDDFPFHYGQAQKWINMTLKYLFMLEPACVDHVYCFFHIPIDNKIMEYLKPYAPPKCFSCAWSRIVNYDEYLSFQNWFRERFGACPLDNEFLLFMDNDAVLPTQLVNTEPNPALE